MNVNKTLYEIENTRDKSLVRLQISLIKKEISNYKVASDVLRQKSPKTSVTASILAAKLQRQLDIALLA